MFCRFDRQFLHDIGAKMANTRHTLQFNCPVFTNWELVIEKMLSFNAHHIDSIDGAQFKALIFRI